VGALQRWLDRFAVSRHGGVRVRILPDGTGVVLGRTPGPTPERILSEVRDLAPGAGVVDVIRTNGRLRVIGSGALANPAFLQRLRNVLGNY
jgi:hypothetical protein